jgi:hypothetical protein
MADVREKSHRSHECEAADVRVGKSFLQTHRRGKERTTFGDDIVDYDDP